MLCALCLNCHPAVADCKVRNTAMSTGLTKCVSTSTPFRQLPVRVLAKAGEGDDGNALASRLLLHAPARLVAALERRKTKKKPASESDAGLFDVALSVGKPTKHPKLLFLLGNWRRGWDSNPRYGETVRLISSQVHSTTLPPLHKTQICRSLRV